MLSETGKTVLEQSPYTLNMVEYDFENYALTQGKKSAYDLTK
jgi:hypothetical protein